VVLSRSGTCYSWGPNEVGQLGHGDFTIRQTPARIKNLEGKKVTSIGVGDDFVIALGLTLPQKEYEKLARTNGILRQQADKPPKKLKQISKPKINYNLISQENKVPENTEKVALR
jgi:hypothetical protein